jgi:2,3-bisphosphoglycerate-dependent phosphoglycerate mutase
VRHSELSQSDRVTPPPQRQLVLLRHGESSWNRENRFTGWTDVDLSTTGTAEAHASARLLSDAGLDFDVAFTSVLKRAIRTLWIVADDLDRMWVPVHRSWRLNERHYGALQGLNKAETAGRFGEAQVHSWRRSYGVRPPPLEPGDSRWERNDPRYATVGDAELPRGESLADTIARVLPCWDEGIAPALRAGQRVLVVAHGNSLRGLVMHLDRLGKEEIAALTIPTGIPLVYRLTPELRPIDHRYLGEPAKVAAAVARVVGRSRADPAAEGATPWPERSCSPLDQVPTLTTWRPARPPSHPHGGAR